MILYFRKTTVEDIPTILAMEKTYGEFVGQWSYKAHQFALSDTNSLHLVFCDDTETVVGYAIVKGLDNQNKSIELMRIAVAKPGQGYGKIALALIQKHCFTILHAHRLWLDVGAHNSRAQKVYESMGFVQEGRLRDSVFYDGHYEDLIVLSILEDEYRRGADFADTIH